MSSHSKKLDFHVIIIVLLDGYDYWVYAGASLYSYLPVKPQVTGDVQGFGAPVTTSAVKHDVVVIFPRRRHIKFLLKVLWGQLQRLLQVAH